jgi:hypothetical protein
MDNKKAIFKTALVLVLIFIIGYGVGVGSTIALWQLRLKSSPLMQPPAQTVHMLTRMLDLDDRQQAQVERIVRQTTQEIQDVRKQTRPKIRQALEQARQEISALLNEEQKKKFDRHVQKSKDRFQRMWGRLNPGVDTN